MNWRTETAQEPSLPLGIDPDGDYSNRDFVLNDDDRLTLYTDGVLGDA
jgi:serine phosphatase RsbU (regulator of sigma subunit)